jgi:RNA polymerase sigma-70 factor (ECF subfamily)
MGVSLDVAFLYDMGPVDEDTPRNGAERALDLRDLADAHLVSRAQHGDFAVFEELVRRYRNDVFRLAYHFTRNREEAWDLSQEVFLKVYKGLGQFRGDANFKTWVLRIAANQCKDFLKKRRLPTVAFNDAIRAEDVPSGLLHPDHVVEAQEIGRAIESALDRLPHKHRTAFILREFEGMSYEEMAQVMHCNPGTVMSRLHHARKKLQRSLIRMGVVED